MPTATRTDESSGPVVCVSDRYDPDRATPYDSVNDFLMMCDWAFGPDDVPTLLERADGWYDTEGLVLERASLRNPEPFCACGRVISECDGSRTACGKRA